MKLKDWVKKNRDIFLERDLKFLLKKTFSKDYVFLYCEDFILSKEDLEYLEEVKKLYLKGIPISYIIGKEEFFGFNFSINPQVFIPRKETEIIVENALRIIKKKRLKYVLDLCCGCGSIGIVLKLHCPAIRVFFSDISWEAVKVTKENLQLHNVEGKIVVSDLLFGFKFNTFDLIISNPPYVASFLIKGSLEFEPRISLEAPERGQYFLKKIIQQAHRYLKEEGMLIMEFGFDQKDTVESLVESLNLWRIKEWIIDYSGIYRGVVLEKLE